MAFTYAQAETILAGLFGADERVQKAAFRGRLKHLKRLGIPLGSRPGRGSKVDYELEHIYQWAWCLELEEFGLDPSLIVAHVTEAWEKTVHPIFLHEPASGEGDVLAAVLPSLMSRPWKGGSGPLITVARVRRADVDAIVGRLTGERRRLSLVNVGAITRQVRMLRVLGAR
ncbi:hypothetical protein [Salinarimonas soli]|uniref:Uncharacterized protein n=1 Tax=Salinarimonas soli TaxID=1638099 RepID=A0A5B2VSX1_9HYPH|nr:hypothetical protein [Salinarimonas soli]KAA2242095.1 hypothetical protein F0L46_03780 [Salinarimonas soli]